MATSLTSLLPPTPTSSKSHLLTPTTTPIPPTPSPYTHLHTPLLVLYYVLRFRSLVVHPITTMTQDLLPLAVAQCVFCAMCLPRAGTWAETRALIEGTSSRARRKGGKKQEQEGWGGIVVATLFSLLLTLPPTIPLSLLLCILGAPLTPTSSLTSTLLLSTHLSLLALLPLLYTHGLTSTSWRDILSLNIPFDNAGVWGGSIGCFIGGWLGAVPIALDWDREWQAWPCTILVGVVGGWAVGRVVSGELGWGVGRRIWLGELEETSENEAVAKKVE